jgi:hypothetical protein
VAAKTPRDWKAFYAREREELGEDGLARLLERAPRVDLPPGGALVFPHTRLATSGELAAAAARAVVASGRETVLAVGVLHRGRERTPARGLHDERVADEEFSLDGFVALLDLAARRAGRAPPRVVARYPFLVGTSPRDLPGIAEVEALVARGAAVVATADPIHHGAGYETPERLAREDPATLARGRASIERGFGLLAGGDLAAFLDHAATERSDFRDAGPVLAHVLSRGSRTLGVRVEHVSLVDYADVLGAEEPTWVAGALASFTH